MNIYREASVCVIVLNWNGWQDTIECVRSLLQLDYPRYEIVVVDNGSTDDSVQKINAAYPEIRVITIDANLGFAGGNNAGIRYAISQKADYVWLLNNDTLVKPDALDRLVEVARSDQKIGAVGSVLFYADQPRKVQAWGGGRVNLWTGRTNHILSPVSADSLNYLTAASILVSAQAIAEVGLLDDKFFMYWEDVDWSLRFTRAGWKLRVAETSFVLHKESASAGRRSPRQDYMYNKSQVYFLRKHSPIPVIPMTLGLVSRLLIRISRGELERARAVWKGFVEGWSTS